jgi:hypothetical protein
MSLKFWAWIISHIVINSENSYIKNCYAQHVRLPRCWFHYVDDIFIIWPHGPDKLKEFLHHLNSIHQSIQFTMETESKATSHSWTWIFTEDGILWHKVCHKPTHTNRYLIAKSYHHPSNKQKRYYPLWYPESELCDEDSLQAELVYQSLVFKQNGYNDRQIYRAPNRTTSPTQSLSCPFSGLYSTVSAQCWPNTTSNLWACPTWNHPVCCVRSKTTWNWG